MNIVKVTDPNLKSEICNSILRKLPLWFGLEAALVEYVKSVASMETWVVYENEAAIGFASVKIHFAETAEIYVIGVLQEYHRKGFGYQLIETIGSELRSQGFKLLTVKTLSASRPNKEYDQTRNFYLKAGFCPVEEFKTLWDEFNPCLLMAKNLN